MVPRNRDLPYAGWRAHHTKEFSKVDKSATIIFEAGELPKDAGEKRKIVRSEAEKKETTDQVLKKIRTMLEEGKDEDAFQAYPRTYMQWGEKLKAMVMQKKPLGTKVFPHIWLMGNPGSGKTALLNFLFPRTYKKDLNNRFFDLYDARAHDFIMLEDMDHQNLDKLGVQFLKTICDESGFPIDQKYKTPQLAKTTVLVTSNFTLNTLIVDTLSLGVTEHKRALGRRFCQLQIHQLLYLLGLKLLPQYELKQLKLKGNDNPGAIFMDWDYIQDGPTGLAIKTPEEYQEKLLGYFYRN
nr:nonstructural protein [Flumine parvovirus 11]